MKPSLRITSVAAVLGIFTALGVAKALPTLEVQSRDYRQAEGGYVKGSLIAADAFEENAATTVKLFRRRNRHYAARELVTLIQSAALAMREIHPEAERLQVGDFSQKNGGEIDGHGSHENGLDVDLAYFRTDARELDPATATEFPDEYVVGGKLSPLFDLEKNLRFLQLLASTRIINRIFVDPVIKARLCAYADTLPAERRELSKTLRYLRPWPAHGDHFHVRIDCPKGSVKCVRQEPVAPGDGCAEVRR